jgi:hypothetical protein
MTDNSAYSLLAIFRELNDREFRKKLALFPEDRRYYVVLAGGIVGSEVSKRVQEAPQAVVEEGGAFVSDMLNIASPGEDQAFKGILEAYLVATLKDELRFCCMNCRKFGKCLNIAHLRVGELFQRHINGEETQELKDALSAQITNALARTPYLDVEDAHSRCGRFVHQYSVSSIGEVFGRYSDIAATLQQKYGIDRGTVLHQMVSVNMEFCEKSNKKSGNR